MQSEPEQIWNGLEIAKLVVSLATPLIGGIIAYRLFKIGQNVEKRQWSGRKVIEKRLDFYDNVGPKLNDLYCYYYRFGNWKELKPTDVIETKRFLDKEFHIYSHIFKENILAKYKVLMDNCFETFTGSGNDAKLKMNLEKRKNLPNWEENWNELFVQDEMVDETSFKKSYNELLYVIKRELEIG
ncbi:hypothetical protein [Maribacter aestuarii]|uniref:hypothetical protein n=1 Tax=Maribacter aestuarii TaxID=1130723 RepID=UPI00248B06CC|nr:hypothetical protein [Maribacter aestuarii]